MWDHNLPPPSPSPNWVSLLSDDRKPFWQSPVLPLLRATIVGEASTESVDGKFAVGCVARNRVLTEWWWGDCFHEVLMFKAQFTCFWHDWGLRELEMTSALQNPVKWPGARSEEHTSEL